MFRFLFAAVALIMPVSCAFVDSVLSSGEGEEAARVGKAVLYESEVARIVPPGLEGRDSALMAERIIDKWRLEQFLKRPKASCLLRKRTCRPNWRLTESRCLFTAMNGCMWSRVWIRR